MSENEKREKIIKEKLRKKLIIYLKTVISPEQKASMTQLDYLEKADDIIKIFNEVFNPYFDSMINKIIEVFKS